MGETTGRTKWVAQARRNREEGEHGLTGATALATLEFLLWRLFISLEMTVLTQDAAQSWTEDLTVMEVFFQKKIFFYLVFASPLLPLPLLFLDLHYGRLHNVNR